MGHIRASAFSGSRRAYLAGIVEADSTRAAELAKLYACRVFTDLDTALRELKGVRGVWVATPTPTHRAAIQQAAAAGKAIGVEKPVAESVEETVECYRTAAGAGVPLYCSFQRRTDPSYQRLLRVVRSGEVGRVMSVHAVFRDHPVPPIEFLKTGGSIYLDLVVHDADFIMHALRETPVKVYARGSSFHPELEQIGVKDHAVVMLHFASGVTATIELSRSSSYGYDQRMEVYGSEGAVELKNPPETHVIHSKRGAIAHDNPMHSFPQRFAQAYLIEVDEFIDCIVGGKAPGVTVADSVNSLLVAEACKRSEELGVPVTLEPFKA